MFVVRTKLTSLGTPCAEEAFARFRLVARAGDEPTVVTVSGRTIAPACLERWIATTPRRRAV